MSEKKQEFPLTLVHENGETAVVRDETQASAFEKFGFKPEEKKGK